MIQDSFTLMILGMSIVFGFLVLLMFSVKAMGAIIPKFWPEAPKKAAVGPSSLAKGGITQEVVAAIGAAVAQHRQKHP
jgi:oxaloacetate decarboxylase gamma subunit